MSDKLQFVVVATESLHQSLDKLKFIGQVKGRAVILSPAFLEKYSGFIQIRVFPRKSAANS